MGFSMCFSKMSLKKKAAVSQDNSGCLDLPDINRVGRYRPAVPFQPAVDLQVWGIESNRYTLLGGSSHLVSG